ncbi:MAG TPA: RsmE family RNA methyltransferase [Spirochaetia bacterium]|nr:RsmE family RNA methyltransferase [Spirochaetia bacterium]
MKQFLLPSSYAGEARLSLTGDDHRYLARVLRLREGAELPAVDVKGSRYRMTILRVDKTRCLAELLPDRDNEVPPGGFSLTLLQCLPKGRKIDLIIRQATEAGVSRVVPLFSERTLVRPADEAVRQARLARVAREALQQSGRSRLPVIEEPRGLASLAAGRGDWGTALFFHEERLSAGSLHELLAGQTDRVSILVGPEGGLSPAEVNLLTAAGFRPAYLGSGVLRVETAALYAIAAVRTIVQEKDAWRAAEKR